MSRRSEYKERSDAILSDLERNGETPEILLHACCAPCSSYVLEHLSDHFRIRVFYYNPNIDPKDEYEKRAAELERLVKEMNPAAKCICAEYDPQSFYEAVQGLESEPEGGKRCEQCFRLRLKEAAKAAAEAGCEYFTTTLTISPHKNAAVINKIGEEISKEYGIKWFPSDFKKNGGFQRSIELSKEYGLYRQDYCGCVFSIRTAKEQENKD